MNRLRIQEICDAWAALWGAIWWPIWDRVAAGELTPEQAQALATSRINTQDPTFLKFSGFRFRHPKELGAAWKRSWTRETKAYVARRVDQEGAEVFSKREILRRAGSGSDCN